MDTVRCCFSDDDDFFACSPKGDIVVSNPPFSKAKEVLQRLVEWNKPFILILLCAKLTTRYVRNSFEDTISDLKLIVPPRRINFDKPGLSKSNSCFDCFYFVGRFLVWKRCRILLLFNNYSSSGSGRFGTLRFLEKR